MGIPLYFLRAGCHPSKSWPSIEKKRGVIGRWGDRVMSVTHEKLLEGKVPTEGAATDLDMKHSQNIRADVVKLLRKT
jgi:hypothetical protein